MGKMKVIIVGAGIVGACIAERLAASGQNVTVLDGGLAAGHASGRSFGWINASFFLNEAHFHLRVQAMEAHRRLQGRHPQLQTRWPGALWWDHDEAATEAQARLLLGLGYGVERLSRDAIKRAEPLIAAPPPLALAFQDEGAVDAADLSRALLNLAAAHGSSIVLGTPVVRLLTAGGRVNGVGTANGQAFADHVVLAAGCATDQLLATVGTVLAIGASPGVLNLTAPISDKLHRIIAGPHAEIRQQDDGSLMIPSRANHQSTEDRPSIADANEVAGASMEGLAAARDLLPGVAMSVAASITGHRPVPPDGLPVVGHVPGIEGLSVAVMHSGVTLAPLVGEVVARELHGGDGRFLGTGFRPDRLVRAGALQH
jgi:D-hydroxyproline dehydrogenase subunit beta